MKRNDANVPFTFHRNILNSSDNDSKNKNCRQRLESRFDDEHDCSSETSQKSDRSVLSVLSLNNPARVFRNSAQKLSKTFSSVRTSIGTFSQKFRPSTKRRQILDEGPATPSLTPQTHSKQVLGRTPTKLYSPFGIESPRAPENGQNKENVPIYMNHKTKTDRISKKAQRDLINDCSSPSSSFFR